MAARLPQQSEGRGGGLSEAQEGARKEWGANTGVRLEAEHWGLSSTYLRW